MLETFKSERDTPETYISFFFFTATFRVSVTSCLCDLY